MKTLLQINASLYSGKGQSSVLACQFVDRWRLSHPGGRVFVRDLATDPVPHLTAERFQAFLTAPAERSAAQAAIAAESDALIGELKSADAIVIGLPMYNFGIPSTLKAWIDHVARAGETFHYTENGPEGLIADRKTYVFAARGGQYVGTPRDTQTRYVTNFFNFIGIRDIEFVYAEGLALGDDQRHQSLDHAARAIDRLAA
jgi:FMN-dependent NADH-azoreductase